AALLAQLAGTAPGELTSCTMSRNTMPSRVTRGRTLRITPVSRYCTWLTVPVSPTPPGLNDTDWIGIRVPTLSVASTLLRTSTDGVCSRRRSVTSSSALITAAALRPRKVQVAPPEPMLPARSPQISRPSALGKPAPPELVGALTACSKNQLTPYFRDRKSTRLNSSHVKISYAVFCLKKKKNI